jgi:hypothetical protein
VRNHEAPRKSTGGSDIKPHSTYASTEAPGWPWRRGCS